MRKPQPRSLRRRTISDQLRGHCLGPQSFPIGARAVTSSLSEPKRPPGGKKRQNGEPHQCLIRELVPQEGLEPPHPCEYQILSLARLPVPPLGPARPHWGPAGAHWSLGPSFRPHGRAKRANGKPDGHVARRSKGTQGLGRPCRARFSLACGARPGRAPLAGRAISPSRRGKLSPRSSNHPASVRSDRTCRDTHRCRHPA
jgi:hypothetical protein